MGVGSQLTVESPRFDQIRKLNGIAIEDAIRLLWFVANNAADTERRDVGLVRDRYNSKVQSDAPTAQQDNYDHKESGTLLFTGGTAFNLTGIRNGQSGRFMILANLGTGTITVKHESASSDAGNRIDTAAAADKTVATNKFLLLHYLNSRWREVSLA